MKIKTVIVSTTQDKNSGWWSTIATVNGSFFSSCTRKNKQDTIIQIEQDLKESGVDYYPKPKAPVMSMCGTFAAITSQLKAA